MKQEHTEKAKKVGITIKMNANTNALLMEAIKRSKRSKRTEVGIRLEDHLKRYETISEIGHVKDRQ